MKNIAIAIPQQNTTERDHTCRSWLVVRGMITEAENVKITKRILKEQERIQANALKIHKEDQ